MKKRILSMFLVLCMVFSLCPTISIPTGAEEPSGTALSGDLGSEYKLAAGSYYLSDDVTGNIVIESDKTVTLDLNGHVLTGKSEEKAVISNYGNLTIKDSNTGSKTYNFNVTESGLWTLTSDAETVKFEDLTARPATGTVVAVTGGCITGGNNTENNAGGGIENRGTLNFESGNIVGNTTPGNGGGILSGYQANISGGNIMGNTANDGGGIYTNGDSANISGGNILYNTSNNNGGGVYHDFGKLNLSGGEISGNTAATAGGGVWHIEDNATFNLGGTAKIIGNTLNDGTIQNLYLARNDYFSDYTVTIGTKTGDTEETKGNGVAAPAEGMEVGVTLGTTDGKGQFTSNGTKADEAYFFSDNTAYADKYNNAGTDTDTSDDYLALVIGYAITCNESENGSVSVGNQKSAYKDETIAVAVTPAEGYELDTLTVQDADSGDVTVTGNTFTMPAKAVTVTGTFKQAEVTYDYTIVLKGGKAYKNSVSGDDITGNVADMGLRYADGAWTMNNFVFNTTAVEAVEFKGAGTAENPEEININVMGVNTITAGDSKTDVSSGISFSGCAEVTISGTGAGSVLNAAAGNAEGNCAPKGCVTSVGTSLTLKNVTANFKAGKSTSGNSFGVSTLGALTVDDGARVTCVSSECGNYSRGIHVASVGSITVKGTGEIYATSAKSASGSGAVVYSKTAQNGEPDAYAVATGTATELTWDTTDKTYKNGSTTATSVTLTVKKSPVCYIDVGNDGSFTDGTDTKYASITKALEVAKPTDETAAKPTVIRMIADSNENINIPAGRFITLDLNGYVLRGDGEVPTAASPDHSVITNAGNLTLTDSGSATVHYFKVSDTGLWELQSGQPEATYTFSAAEGLKKGNETTTEIPAAGSIIAVSGGCITGGTGAYFYDQNSKIGVSAGGGVYSTGSLTMEGGNIIGNTATTDGGGVRVYTGSTFTMKGGSIIGNTAVASGGGVRNDGTFTMKGGYISDNTANSMGGGVFNVTGSFSLENGSITGNTANSLGGGVLNMGTFTLEKGSITGNTANSLGGGVLNITGTVTIGDTAQITGNTATTAGNNLTVMAPFALGDGNTVAKPASGMKVGVSLLDDNGAYITGKFTTNGTTEDVGYFFSDTNDYYVALHSEGGLELREHDHSWKYSLSKDQHTVTAAYADGHSSGFQDTTLTIQVPESLTYDGNSHEVSFGNASTFCGGNLPEITYAYKATQDGEYTPTTETGNVGYYKASFSVGEGENSVTAYIEYEIVAKKDALKMTISGDDTARHTDVKSYTVSFEGDRPAGTTVVWDITGGTYEYIGDHIGTNSVSIICEDVGTLHITATLVDHAGRPVLNSDGEIVRATKDVNVKADSGNILNMIARAIRTFFKGFSKLFK